MVSINDVTEPAAVERLDALVELARVSRSGPVEGVFEAVAQVLASVVGFSVVVVNVYRPAWDDYEVVLVHGPQDAREALLHTVNSSESWLAACLDPRHEVVPGAFFIPEEDLEAWAGMETFFTPDLGLAPVDDPNAWLAGDGLLVPLRSSNGALLGVLSLDVPLSGQRPSVRDLEMLVAVGNHATAALENAHSALEAERHRKVLTALLEVSSLLARQTTVSGVLERVCDSAVADLGFESVTVYMVYGAALLSAASRGELGPDQPVDLDAVLEILARSEDGGTVLVTRTELVPGSPPSSLSGKGPLAWDDHRLLVPLRASDAKLIALVVLDNPLDRLLPNPLSRQALLLLADRGAAALESIDRQSQLEHLAGYDPLTGVRNRRDLVATIDAYAAQPGGVSVLMCDLDHFKGVNDHFGHETGDRVLERFGSVLQGHSRSDDVAFRVGGEEFCLVLPRIDAQGAVMAAERLRQATKAVMGDLVPGLTVSIGTATSDRWSSGGAALLAAADGALYAAKASGRDRACSAEGIVVAVPVD